MSAIKVDCSDSKNLQDRGQKIPQFLSIRRHLETDPFDSTDPKPWRMFLLLGHEMYSQAVLGCRDR
jgi:hypothetical protein